MTRFRRRQERRRDHRPRGPQVRLPVARRGSGRHRGLLDGPGSPCSVSPTAPPSCRCSPRRTSSAWARQRGPNTGGMGLQPPPWLPKRPRSIVDGSPNRYHRDGASAPPSGLIAPRPRDDLERHPRRRIQRAFRRSGTQAVLRRLDSPRWLPSCTRPRPAPGEGPRPRVEWDAAVTVVAGLGGHPGPTDADVSHRYPKRRELDGAHVIHAGTLRDRDDPTDVACAASSRLRAGELQREVAVVAAAPTRPVPWPPGRRPHPLRRGHHRSDIATWPAGDRGRHPRLRTPEEHRGHHPLRLDPAERGQVPRHLRFPTRPWSAPRRRPPPRRAARHAKVGTGGTPW